VSEAPPRTIGLVLAGQHPLTLCGLSQVFGREADCAVLEVCTDVEGTLDAVRRHQPDVLMLDLDRNGTFKILRRVQRERLATRVVVLAAASEETDMVDAMRVGARAIVFKELPPEAFVACVRKVHREERWLDTPHDGRLVTRLSRNGTSARHSTRQLTPRETEIARLAVLGISTRDIAERLDVKQGTVKIHLHSIYEKLNVGGRLGLVLFARRHGLA
jgi:two-component system nitrate/nitrite response regulator NarL